ncbi:MAG: hypothetical protein RID91_03230 [Azospirillaceae bacterium]
MADTHGAARTEAKGGGDDSASALRDDIDRLREDMAALTRDLGSAGSDRARHVRDRTRDTVNDGYQRSRGFVETEMSERPLAVLGISFAAGLLVGRLLGR